MSSEQAFEHKGKVQPKPSQETAEPKKELGRILLPSTRQLDLR